MTKNQDSGFIGLPSTAPETSENQKLHFVTTEKCVFDLNVSIQVPPQGAWAILPRTQKQRTASPSQKDVCNRHQVLSYHPCTDKQEFWFFCLFWDVITAHKRTKFSGFWHPQNSLFLTKDTCSLKLNLWIESLGGNGVCANPSVGARIPHRSFSFWEEESQLPRKILKKVPKATLTFSSKYIFW